MSSLTDASASSLPPLDLKRELAKLLAERQRRRDTNKLASYQPYEKQREFHAAGSFRERLFMAGNQLGKTVAGGYEVAIHAAGRYPDWWVGRRWDRPTVWWVSGVSGESTRDNPQRILLGRPDHGTGAIPKECIEDVTAARGVPGLVDTIKVKHESGGTSLIIFKSYEKGREKWQGDTLDGVWFDEEPPMDVYSEGVTRTNATGGLVFLTFTPLMGMSDVVSRYLMEESADRHVTQMTIDDAEHYTEEDKARIIASYPPHEREARARGVPIMGSGRVFPVAEEEIKCEPFSIPAHWPQIGGMDFGWDHPFAAIRSAWDRDSDCFYVTAEYRQSQATPLIHSGALKPWGAWLPWAWPHDGLAHEKGTGKTLAVQYEEHGLKMLAEKATFEDGGLSVEAGITEILERMQTRRFKVFSTCGLWFEEFRLYHRKDGVIVKERDDLMAATRYAYMMRRHAKTNSKIPAPKVNTRWVV